MTGITLPTEKPMRATALQPLPRRADVAREQLRSVGMSVQREALACTGILGLMSIVLVWDRVHRYSGAVHLLPTMLIPAALVALLMPMAMWKGEGPGRRAYHRAMPVDHAHHAIARTAAGLAWLLAAIGAYAGWMVAMAVITGGQVYSHQGYQWAAPVAGAVVLYLIGSALALRVEHPWRWMGGAVAGFVFMAQLSDGKDPIPVFATVQSLLTGKYGLGTLVSGLSPVPHSRVDPVSGEAYSWVTQQAVAGVWMTAVWIWLAAAITLFLWSAYRQPEG
jgi:hypothetical protein